MNKPKWTQAAIISAGVGFNFLLAWFLFSVGFTVGLPAPAGSFPAGASITNEQLIITEVRDDSPAAGAGLAVGDVIVSLQSGDDTLQDIIPANVQEFVTQHDGKEIALTYKKDEKEHTTIVVPQKGIIGEVPAIGIAMTSIGLVRLPPHRAIFEGGKMTVALTGSVVVAFAGLIADAFAGNADLANLAGPVGIVSLVGDATDLGFAYLISFVAFISINLAVLNLLPIPALDGGRLLFLFIEVIKGSPISPKVVNFAHALGFALLILLMLVVTYNDIAKLFAS